MFRRYEPIDERGRVNFAAGILTPIGRHKSTHPLAFVRVRSNTVTVTFRRRTLAHIVATGLKVIDGIQATVAVAEQLGLFQRLAVMPISFLSTDWRFRQTVIFAWARLDAANFPRVGKPPNVIVRVIYTFSGSQIISIDIIVVAAQATQLAFVWGGRLHLQKARAVPQQIDANVGDHADAVVRSIDL